ncbi:VanZ family protein [Ferruginibacter lapsinanis]|uniref:VanZ family protein n=1 Tax=Ferruginibacter lapsinanis TaxID=563172 RepID=UPI001E5E3AFA|nr:VanZ family protein [Ferruginibacter lapsinanis]UEG50493.1 VanZ family protein [Ferruginibacter lapsinanis]
MKKIPISKFLPGIIWFIVVLVLMCTPGKDLPEVDDWFQKLYIDKWIHAGTFGLLAYLFMYPFQRAALATSEKLQYFLRIALAASIWGLTIEFIQKYYIPNRSFDLLDWAADTVGVIITFVFLRKNTLKKADF